MGRQPLLKVVELLHGLSELVPGRIGQALVGAMQLLAQARAVGRGCHRCAGWGRCAQIGNEIGNAEVGFVADTGDHRCIQVVQGARQGLVVERPQVFERASTTRQDDDFAKGVPVGGPDGANQFGRGLLALNGAGVDADLRVRPASCQRLQDIADGRAGRRGHHADAARPARQRPLGCFIEQTFGGQFLLERLECQSQGTCSGLEHRIGDQLIVAARFIQAQAAANQNFAAVARLKRQAGCLASKQGAAQLRAGILEREIEMS